MKLLVLIGPTAVGKTKYSLEIAKRFNCEIISGDSMQVYRGMDIGTAKISKEEREHIPHHLIDVCEPTESFSVSEFKRLAEEKIKEITARGKLPFIVGGTGLYIESLLFDYRFNDVSSDEQFRKEQEQFAEEHGSEALHQKLLQIDPESANRIHPNDLRRTIRALEVYHMTGQTFSDFLKTQKIQSPYEYCILGLTMDRSLLYKQIEERVDQMFQDGLVQEVEQLLARGLTKQMVSMQGLGYKEIIPYLNGEYTLEEASRLLKRDTRRFAKRQLSWFRHMKDIHWVDVTERNNFVKHMQQISGIITSRLNVNSMN